MIILRTEFICSSIKQDGINSQTLTAILFVGDVGNIRVKRIAGLAGLTRHILFTNDSYFHTFTSFNIFFRDRPFRT